MVQNVPDYLAIGSGEKDAGSPLTASLVERLDTNPAAMMGGAAGAPRLLPAATFSEISAGDVLRWSLAEIQGSSNGSVSFGRQIFNFGTVRVVFSYSASSSGIRKNGTPIFGDSGSGARTVDLAVAPGDLITFYASGASSVTPKIRYAQFKTNGELLTANANGMGETYHVD